VKIMRSGHTFSLATKAIRKRPSGRKRRAHARRRTTRREALPFGS
jgi:hypothetical protein